MIGFLLSLVAAPTARSAAQDSALLIEHVAVVDVASGTVRADQYVLIDGRRIISVGSTRPKAAPTAQIVPGRGRWLIPGLWDMHVHLVSFPSWADAFLPLAVANGVLGIRDMHSRSSNMIAVVREIAAGTRVGPRVFASGEAIDGPLSLLPGARVVHDTAEARAAVRELAAVPVQFIKVYTTLPKDLYLAVADEARRNHLPFAGHVPYAVTAAEASEAGQRSIEHSTGVDVATSREAAAIQADQLAGLAIKEFRTPDADRLRATYDSAKANALFALLARNQTWQVPTLIVERQIASHAGGRTDQGDSALVYVPASVRSFWPSAGPSEFAAALEKLLPFHLELLARLHRAGVPILAGSDAPNPYVYPGIGLHEELALLVRAGLSPAEALRAATLSPARFLGLTDSLGTIEGGRIAECVLLDANPLADIRNTRRIRAVIQGGRWLGRGQLDELLVASKRAAAASPPPKPPS